MYCYENTSICKIASVKNLKLQLDVENIWAYFTLISHTNGIQPKGGALATKMHLERVYTEVGDIQRKNLWTFFEIRDDLIKWNFQKSDYCLLAQQANIRFL
ncbi:hypothetical protein RF11_03833 [Thelohanellus kitauei]|uniref:Uncharacterized protein n=1 Tax=Thelohanellus kitauei TaxID=669202 RepID=A0A0C2IU33_THEKT|nr:hypothetical protein RF11_03833 [Thelohanellus kitauei]